MPAFISSAKEHTLLHEDTLLPLYSGNKNHDVVGMGLYINVTIVFYFFFYCIVIFICSKLIALHVV